MFQGTFIRKGKNNYLEKKWYTYIHFKKFLFLIENPGNWVTAYLRPFRPTDIKNYNSLLNEKKGGGYHRAVFQYRHYQWIRLYTILFGRIIYTNCYRSNQTP